MVEGINGLPVTVQYKVGLPQVEVVVVGVMGINLHGLLDTRQPFLRATGILEQGGEQHVGIGVVGIIFDGLLRLDQGLYIFVLFGRTSRARNRPLAVPA